jgi:hypothetical protein
VSEKTLYKQILDDFLNSISEGGVVNPSILIELEDLLSEDKKLPDKQEVIHLLQVEE